MFIECYEPSPVLNVLRLILPNEIVLLPSLFYKQGIWGRERLSNLPKMTQLVYLVYKED